jgi:hypothetical protein
VTSAELTVQLVALFSPLTTILKICFNIAIIKAIRILLFYYSVQRKKIQFTMEWMRPIYCPFSLRKTRIKGYGTDYRYCPAKTNSGKVKGNLLFKLQKTGSSEKKYVLQFNRAPAANNWLREANQLRAETGLPLLNQRGNKSPTLIAVCQFPLSANSGKPIAATNRSTGF